MGSWHLLAIPKLIQCNSFHLFLTKPIHQNWHIVKAADGRSKIRTREDNNNHPPKSTKVMISFVCNIRNPLGLWNLTRILWSWLGRSYCIKNTFWWMYSNEEFFHLYFLHWKAAFPKISGAHLVTVSDTVWSFQIELSSSQKHSDVQNKVHDHANCRCRNIPSLVYLSLCVFMSV